MTTYEDALAILNEIDLITNRVSFKDNSQLKSKLDSTVLARKQILIEVKENYAKIMEEDNKTNLLLLEEEKKFNSAMNELKEMDNMANRKKNCEVTNISSPSELKEREDIRELKEVLSTYQDLTCVRFAYDAPEDVVSGFIGIRGETPSKNLLQPFIFKKNETVNIPEQIWSKIHQTVNEMLMPGIVDDFEEMDISAVD